MLPHDFPVIVVNEHVVMSAQEDSVRDIRLTAVARPVVDVVSLSPAGRTVASFEHAPAIAHGKRDLLMGSEQSRFPAKIDDVATTIEYYGDRSPQADRPFDRFNADRIFVSLNAAVTRTFAKCLLGDEHPHSGNAGPHNSWATARPPGT